MMTFSYVDLNSITDTDYELFKSINEWICKDSLTQVYVVKDNDDIKSVFCLCHNYSYIEFELSFGTKERERHKGYCDFGFHMIMEIIKNNPSIKGVIIDSINETTDFLCKKYEIFEFPDNLYYFSNPNFNPKYKELSALIDANTSLEDLIAFCEDDEIMLAILNYWLGFYDNDNKNKKLKIS